MNDAIKQVVRLASQSDINNSFGVWVEDGRTFADNCRNAPAGTQFTHVAQRWDDKTVQLRSSGGTSEFIAA